MPAEDTLMDARGIHSSEHWLVPGEVEVCAIADLTCGRRTVVDREPLEKVVFLYLLDGRAKVRLSDAGEFTLDKDEILVIFPGRVLTLELTGAANRLMSVVLTGPSAVRAAAGLGYWDLMRTVEGYEGNYMTEIIEHFHAAPAHGRDARVLLQVEHLLSTIWLRVRHSSGRGVAFDAVRAINRGICSGDCQTTERAAEVLGVSRSKLNVLLLGGLGMRPGEYISRVILALAKARLFWSAESVSKTAARFGFSSASAFAVFFRRLTGQTPAEFRKSPMASCAVKIQNRSK